MVLETAYGKWALEVAQGDLGVGLAGRPVLDVLRERAPTTLWLIGSALLGGYLIGLALGLWQALTPWGQVDAWTSLLATVLAALPTAVVAVLLRPTAAMTTATAGVLTMLAVAAGLVSRYQRAGARGALEQEYARLLSAQGASRARIAVRTLRNSSSAMVSHLGTHLPGLLTAAFVVEKVYGMAGLGAVTIQAVTEGDVAWLMALALCTVIAAALVQLFSDALLSALDPRVRAVSAAGQEERS
jgi:peptide/nickel transport system permease protein